MMSTTDHGHTARTYIVTVKEYQKGHNPRDKQLGVCLSSKDCTDSTGHHHSLLMKNVGRKSNIPELLKQKFGKVMHITRTEEVND